uniref:Uncharacterized protein n=1 Tax=Tanacetum cinerariifolium TaxID=118510 RepID=A0A6L2KP56_TANCI|nr:hypothetical protein [Tanacetum cinerariifolium]
MAAAMKHIDSSFAKLEKFEGVNFRRWQKKMHFMLSSMSVVYVLTATMLEDGGENPTVKQVRKRAKWDNDDYVCRGLILNELGNHLRIEGVQDSDKPKGNNVAGPSVVNMGSITTPPGTMTTRDCKAGNVGNKANGSSTKGSEDGSSNPLKGQSMFNKSHQIYYVTYVYEAFFVQDDDVAWWVDSGATVHVCKDRCWFKTYELLNDESILHMGNESTTLVHGRGCVDLRLGYLHFKKIQDMSKDGLIPTIDMDTEKCKTCMLNKITKKPFQNVKRETKVLELIQSDLCDLHATISLGNKKYFVIFIDDAYVYFLHSKDKALDKFKVFKTEVELQQESLIKRFRTDRGREYMDTMYFQVWDCKTAVRLPDPKLKLWVKEALNAYLLDMLSIPRLSGSHLSLDQVRGPWTPKDFGPEFQLYLIEGTMDEVSDQHSYCFNVEDDPKTFDEAMKSQDVALWKKVINDEMDSIMGNNTWVLTDLHPGCKPLGCKWIFKRKLKIIHQMDEKTTFLNKELEEEAPKQWHQNFDEVVLSNGYLLNQADKCVYSKFDASGKGVIICLYADDMLIFGTNQVQSHYIEKVLKKFNYSDCTPVSTHLNTCEKLMPNRGPAVSQLEYSRVIGCLMYAMTYTRPDIVFAVGKLSRYTSNPGTQHWQAIQRVLKYLKKTIDYRLVYSGYPSVLEGYTDASWISNTEDNSSTTAGKEAEWLKNLLLEIPLWVKPMAPISIRCDSAATLAKTYIHMYNEKSRHLGVRHSMICDLITNRMVSIEFVKSQQNLADHLTKGLARDLVIKSVEGMRSKSN